MSAESRVATQPGRASQPGLDTDIGAARFTRARIERIIGLVVGFGVSVLGLQAFLNALSSEQVRPELRLAMMVAIFVPLAGMIVSCFVGRLMIQTAGVFAIVLPIGLLLWPAVTAGQDPSGPAWIWYLINVATSAAALAFSLRLQVVWAAAVPLLYGVVRLIQLDFAPDDLVPVALEVVFGIILAGVVLVLGWMLRSVAADMDRTRADTVRSYAVAAAEHAAEEERVAVSALMHDSVLAALIAASRAETPRERVLAVSMAGEALTRLANADHVTGEGPDAPVEVVQVAAGLERAAVDLGVPAPVGQDVEFGAPPLPGRVARAFVLAGIQAISNAVEHAGALDLAIDLEARGGRMLVRISDGGPGFDTDHVPEDRLGIRGSIVARMAAVGGSAQVSSSGSGTTVTMRWGDRR